MQSRKINGRKWVEWWWKGKGRGGGSEEGRFADEMVKYFLI
jgi:hypothetical protein